jgi:hypothetical protein
MGSRQAADQARIRSLQPADHTRRDLFSQPLKPKIQAQLEKGSQDYKRRNAARREKENREKSNEKRRASKQKTQSDVMKATS